MTHLGRFGDYRKWHLGAQILVIFPLKFPSKPKKTTTMGGKGPRAKTKIVLKSVSKVDQFESMHDLKYQTFLNKNPPTVYYFKFMLKYCSTRSRETSTICSALSQGSESFRCTSNHIVISIYTDISGKKQQDFQRSDIIKSFSLSYNSLYV